MQNIKLGKSSCITFRVLPFCVFVSKIRRPTSRPWEKQVTPGGWTDGFTQLVYTDQCLSEFDVNDLRVRFIDQGKKIYGTFHHLYCNQCVPKILPTLQDFYLGHVGLAASPESSIFCCFFLGGKAKNFLATNNSKESRKK